MEKQKWFKKETVRRFGLFAGPLIALIAYFLLPPAYQNDTGRTIPFTHAARA